MAAPVEPAVAGAPVAAPPLASALAPGRIVVGAAVNVADFAELARAMTEEDERREVLIKKSREVLKASKGAIYNLHRRDVAKAREQLAGAVAIMKGELLPLVAAYPSLRFSLSGALEEYAEAVVFSEYLASGRIITMAELESESPQADALLIHEASGGTASAALSKHRAAPVVYWGVVHS